MVVEMEKSFLTTSESRNEEPFNAKEPPFALMIADEGLQNFLQTLEMVSLSNFDILSVMLVL